MAEGGKQGGTQRSLQWHMIIWRLTNESHIIHHLVWLPGQDWEELGGVWGGVTHFLVFFVWFYNIMSLQQKLCIPGIPQNSCLLMAYCSRYCQVNVKLSSRNCFSEGKFYSRLIVSAKVMGNKIFLCGLRERPFPSMFSALFFSG